MLTVRADPHVCVLRTVHLIGFVIDCVLQLSLLDLKLKKKKEKRSVIFAFIT